MLASPGHRAAVRALAYDVVHAHQRHLVVTVPAMLAALVLGHALAGVDRVPRGQLCEEAVWLAHEARPGLFFACVWGWFVVP